MQKINWKNGRLYYGDIRRDTINVRTCYGRDIARSNELLSPLLSAFENLFDNLYYLGPTRVHPQRHYHWEGKHPKEVDLWGNKAIDALLSARVRQSKTPNKETGVPIEEKISEWLRKMELAHSFWLGPSGSLDDNNYEVRIRKSSNSAQVTLADMGHGLADLLPLLVHCCYVPEGSTLVLEQPGVHLHPMAQAQLADLFLDVIDERNLQILVESHSEHLLTRLQRRIAEKQIAQDNIALYFCRNNDGASTIEELDVTESGEIKNWPENFFGDVMGDMFAMTDVQAKQIAEQSSED
jgi:predicted ATPase